MCFEQEILKYIPNLRKFARALLKNNDIEDLVQDTLIRALEKKHLYKDNSLRGWLFTLMHGIYVNNIRKSSRSPIEYVDEYYHEPVASDNPEMSLIIRDVTKAFNNLTEDHKQVIIAHIVKDNEIEIAETLNVPVGTAKSRISRARNKIREGMDVGIKKRLTSEERKINRAKTLSLYKERNKAILREKDRNYKQRIRNANRNSSNSQLSP